ncbi:hypothetical protein Hypma_009715 [Hypsizygus marmoreus]|uniref:Uncharacterized protein n=1 Tax=Hypsizygus marmoreus TaxID=39966 RepID=A0A369JWL0_HYPMA|nr:hypothetical protein Hypma_009715 [Hypsizygus marmoreus]
MISIDQVGAQYALSESRRDIEFTKSVHEQQQEYTDEEKAHQEENDVGKLSLTKPWWTSSSNPHSIAISNVKKMFSWMCKESRTTTFK